MSRIRNCMFTIFNQNWSFTPNNAITYIIVQLEKAPTTGHLHYQGYAEFDAAYSIKRIKELLNSDNAHIEQRMGTQEQAINYCSKEETRLSGPWSLGNPRQQGKRSDLLDVQDKLKNGATIGSIVEENMSTFIKYSKGIKEAKFYLDKKSSSQLRDISVTLIWGESGAGKSKLVWEKTQGYKDTFKLDRGSGNSIWFDGYDGEKTLWIDDFTGNWISLGMLLNLLDRYPLRLDIKGSHTWANWNKVYITSNSDWDTWYPNIMEEHKKAIGRRIVENINLNKDDLTYTVYNNGLPQTHIQKTSIPQIREEEIVRSIMGFNS